MLTAGTLHFRRRVVNTQVVVVGQHKGKRVRSVWDETGDYSKYDSGREQWRGSVRNFALLSFRPPFDYKRVLVVYAGGAEDIRWRARWHCGAVRSSSALALLGSLSPAQGLPQDKRLSVGPAHFQGRAVWRIRQSGFAFTASFWIDRRTSRLIHALVSVHGRSEGIQISQTTSETLSGFGERLRIERPAACLR